MVPSPDHGFTYELYKPSDADDVADLFGRVFTSRDPPHVAVGLTPPEFEDFVHIFLPRKETELLTVVARCAGSGTLAGAMFTDDLASELPDGYGRVSAKFEPIDDMLAQLSDEYLGDKTLRPGEYLHLFLLGVDPRFAGRGIAQRLVVGSMANGARRGYATAVTEATNTTSQHIFRKLGFQERVYRAYRDYRMNGCAVFAPIEDHGGMILLDSALRNRNPAV
jgi:ribosomal protein S18 acetylase RimI-like enzyme